MAELYGEPVRRNASSVVPTSEQLRREDAVQTEVKNTCLDGANAWVARRTYCVSSSMVQSQSGDFHGHIRLGCWDGRLEGLGTFIIRLDTRVRRLGTSGLLLFTSYGLADWLRTGPDSKDLIVVSDRKTGLDCDWDGRLGLPDWGLSKGIASPSPQTGTPC